MPSVGNPRNNVGLPFHRQGGEKSSLELARKRIRQQRRRATCFLFALCIFVVLWLSIRKLLFVKQKDISTPESPNNVFKSPVVNNMPGSYHLGVDAHTKIEHFYDWIPSAPGPSISLQHTGCREFGNYIKGTLIPCMVSITDKTEYPTCWDSIPGVSVDFHDNSKLLNLLSSLFPDLWSYLDPQYTSNGRNPKHVHWVQRADVWRYAKIYETGGIYSDSDACPLAGVHVDDWLANTVQNFANNSDTVDAIFGIEEMTPTLYCGEPFTPGQFNQWTFAASAKNPIMFHILQQVHQQMLLGQPDIIASTGPRVFTRAILDFISRFNNGKKGFRDDGIPHAMTSMLDGGKSKVIKCTFHNQDVNVLILGKNAFNKELHPSWLKRSPVDDEAGIPLVKHSFLGSWKDRTWLQNLLHFDFTGVAKQMQNELRRVFSTDFNQQENCHCWIEHNCFPAWIKEEPITRRYKVPTQNPLSRDYDASQNANYKKVLNWKFTISNFITTYYFEWCLA